MAISSGVRSGGFRLTPLTRVGNAAGISSGPAGKSIATSWSPSPLAMNRRREFEERRATQSNTPVSASGTHSPAPFAPPNSTRNPA